MRQIAAENHEDPHLLDHINNVFRKTGLGDAGKTYSPMLVKKLFTLNNQGVLAARSGDLEGSVRLLMQAADKYPARQFLVNAAKAIYSLWIKQAGTVWNSLIKHRPTWHLPVKRKTAKVPRFASAREMSAAVAKNMEFLVLS